MNYATIKRRDIADGPGVRVSLFVSGCRHRCPGCFNEEAWDFAYGKPFTDAVMEEILEDLSPAYVRGLTLLGGEPLDPDNQGEVARLIRRVREQLPKKDIWCYTGYLLERDLWGWMQESCPDINGILPSIDVLVDGPFVQEKKNIQLLFRGSENQRLIDIRQSLAEGSAVLWEG